MGLFLHGNAPADRALATQNKLAYLGFGCPVHLPYFPYLVPSDYHLFPELKKQYKCRHFSSDAEVIVAARTGWTDRLMNVLSGLLNLEQRAKKFIELRVGVC